MCPKCGYKIEYRPHSTRILNQMSEHLREGILDEYRWHGNLRCPECGLKLKIPLLTDFLHEEEV